MEKPKILSDEEVNKWLESRKLDTPYPYYRGVSSEEHREAQLDADVAYYEPLIQQAKGEVAREIIKLIDSLENNEEAFVDDVDFRNPSSRGKPLWDIEGMYKHLEAHKQTYKKIKEAIESKYGGKK